MLSAKAVDLPASSKRLEYRLPSQDLESLLRFIATSQPRSRVCHNQLKQPLKKWEKPEPSPRDLLPVNLQALIFSFNKVLMVDHVESSQKRPIVLMKTLGKFNSQIHRPELFQRFCKDKIPFLNHHHLTVTNTDGS